MEDGRRGASVVVLLCVIASAIAWPRAQAPPQAVFRAGVDVVHLDVSVLDRDRRPVRGLT